MSRIRLIASWLHAFSPCLLLMVLAACQGEAPESPNGGTLRPSSDPPAAVAPPAPEASEAPVVRQVVDLSARLAEFQRTRPDATDGEFYIYRSPEATVHMHVIGAGQMCPLHIHRTTHEATIIVSGEPEVVHVYGDGDALTQTTRRIPPGWLVYSRPLCGHQWTNDTSTPQGNLVIAAPKFDGNLYLHADDVRMLPGSSPTLSDPDAALEAMPQSGWAPLELGGTTSTAMPLRLAVVRDRLTVHEDPAKDTVLYVARGQGQLAGQALQPGVAVVLGGGEAEVIEAVEPMVVWVFSPPTHSPGSK